MKLVAPVFTGGSTADAGDGAIAALARVSVTIASPVRWRLFIQVLTVGSLAIFSFAINADDWQ
jgi:hypothetical protein